MSDFEGFHTILIDPPWPEKGGCGRGAQNHYPVLSVKDIVPCITSSPVWFPAEACHLYLWTTNNYLIHALGVMKDLGFRYVTKIDWTKDLGGLGYYFQGFTESLLFGTMGPTQVPRWKLEPGCKRQSTHILEMRREHSRKPEQQYERIENVSYPPYLEMFARHPRPGWYNWGNEVNIQDEEGEE